MYDFNRRHSDMEATSNATGFCKMVVPNVIQLTTYL